MITETKSSLEDYKRLAYAIASQYVEEPASLRVSAKMCGEKVVVTFPGAHAKKDHGKLIGGQGRNFRALLRLLQEFASHSSHQLDLEIFDPGGDRPPNVDKPKAPWDDERDKALAGMLEDIAEQVFGYPVPITAYSKYDRTHLVLRTSTIKPEILESFVLLWKAIGRNLGRDISVSAEP